MEDNKAGRYYVISDGNKTIKTDADKADKILERLQRDLFDITEVMREIHGEENEIYPLLEECFNTYGNDVFREGKSAEIWLIILALRRLQTNLENSCMTEEETEQED